MKTKVNFIITCFDKENYWEDLKSLILSYTTIEPTICLAYNGTDPNFPADVRIENSGLQKGEYELIMEGYKFLVDKDVESDLFVKLSIDSWLCDEDVINKIFSNMRHFRVPYGGNNWDTPEQLSTDIFFANIAYGNLFESFRFDGAILENAMYNSVARLGGRFYRINEREPVHLNNRFSCETLGWTMSHDLNENRNFLKRYQEQKPKRDIFNNFAAVCRITSDINQLLPTIHKYALNSETIVEMGVREVVSTWAFLAANPKSLRSFDIEESQNVAFAESLSKEAGIDFKFKKQDVIDPEFEIDEVDLLFIDTWHRYDQLKKELAKHGNKAKKYLIFHDTETFGFKDEEETDFRKQPQGLIPAIEEFLAENPHWVEVERLLINNGLLVLERK